MIDPVSRFLTLHLPKAYARKASARMDREMCGAEGGFWLFILGVNNSGTTILSRILEAHPEIRTLPAEGQLLTTAFPRPDFVGAMRLWSSRMDLFRWTGDHDPRPALLAKKDWAGLFSEGTGILLEKSPPNTVRSLWLQANFRPSRFLSIIRCPYAVCEGIRRRVEKYTIRQAAQHWVLANQCMLDDLHYIKQSVVIRYEQLVEDPNVCLSEIEGFLGLKTPFDPGASGNVEAHSIEGNTVGLQNLNEESFNRLSQEDVQAINEVCGDLMSELGYPFSP